MLSVKKTSNFFLSYAFPLLVISLFLLALFYVLEMNLIIQTTLQIKNLKKGKNLLTKTIRLKIKKPLI